jgi:Holliday junction resolvase RusA-like endonuclease
VHPRAWLDTLPRQDQGDGRGGVFFWRYDVWKARKEDIERKKAAGQRIIFGGLYIHEFERPDNDRCMHDHPWWFITLVFRGGYWEETSTGRHWRRPGSLLFRKATFAHRIDLEPGRKAMSLVLVGEKSRGWGFYTPEGWKPWTPGFSPICEGHEAD